MENLEDIKVGDKAILYFQNTEYMIEVKRLTKNLIVAVGGDKFYKKNGYMVGGFGSPPPYIRKVTAELLSKYESRKQLIQNIVDYPWGKLSTEELEKVYELINK